MGVKMKKNFCLLYVTAKDIEEGKYLVSKALEKNLAACGNIIPHIFSIYKWEGDIKIDNEAVILFKTLESKYKKLENLIINYHSYEIPCILKIDIHNINKQFLNWVFQQTK